jgi:hypothetical protein
VLFVAYLSLGAAVLVNDESRLRLPLALACAALLFLALRRPTPLEPKTLASVIVANTALTLTHQPLETGARRAILSLLMVSIGAIAFACLRSPKLARIPTVGLVLGTYAIAGAVVIASMTWPRIDVYRLQQGGAQTLEHGLDPYAVTYPNPYTREETLAFFGDARTELREYPYPPLSLVATTVSHLVSGDVRWILLPVQIGIAMILFALARGAGHDRAVALGIGALHLQALRGLHVLEYAWNDSLVALAFVAVVLLVQRRAPGLGVVLGCFLAAKQYSVLAIPLLARREFIPARTWIVSLGVALGISLPFFLWAPGGFVEDLILFQLRQPFRIDALSVPAYVAKVSGWKAPGAVALAAAAAGLALTWPRVRKAASLETMSLAAAILYMMFFLFAKQSFCNYYYFVGVLILCSAALLDPRSVHAARARGGVKPVVGAARQ